MSRTVSGRVHCLRALPGGQSVDSRGATRAAITRAIVRLLRARIGKGPTIAKTEMSADLALVTLGDCLTREEETLLSEGQGRLAEEAHAAVYDGMRADAVAAVEAITGRQVSAYLTAHDLESDLSLIAFHFGGSPA